jgi:hypothetical protein
MRKDLIQSKLLDNYNTSQVFLNINPFTKELTQMDGLFFNELKRVIRTPITLFGINRTQENPYSA